MKVNASVLDKQVSSSSRSRAPSPPTKSEKLGRAVGLELLAKGAARHHRADKDGDGPQLVARMRDMRNYTRLQAQRGGADVHDAIAASSGGAHKTRIRRRRKERRNEAAHPGYAPAVLVSAARSGSFIPAKEKPSESW